MKIIFVLDDQTIIVSSPEELQLRQLSPYLAGLVLPAGKNEQGEELLRPLITYPVVLALAPKPEPIPAGEATPVPTAPVPPVPTDISTGKKRKAKKASIQ